MSFELKAASSSSSVSRTAISNLLFSKPLFASAVVWISCASAYDAYLVYRYREGVEELNPICNWLIQLAPDSTFFFLLGKAAGTMLVVGVLFTLYRYWKPASHAVALALALFQMGLMVVIHTIEPSSPRKQVHAQWPQLSQNSAASIEPSPPIRLSPQSPNLRVKNRRRQKRRDREFAKELQGLLHHRPWVDRFQKSKIQHRQF